MQRSHQAPLPHHSCHQTLTGFNGAEAPLELELHPADCAHARSERGSRLRRQERPSARKRQKDQSQHQIQVHAERWSVDDMRHAPRSCLQQDDGKAEELRRDSNQELDEGDSAKLACSYAQGAD